MTTKTLKHNNPPAAVAVADALLLPADVAARLRVTIKALEHWRRRGEGPRFLRLGRNCVRYREEDIEAFVSQRVLPGQRA